jgi:hypothetical protein
MTNTLDIYIRAHGGAERNARVLNLQKLSKLSLFSYCPSGGLLSSEAADSLIFNRICKNLDIDRRAKVFELTQSKTMMEYLHEGFSTFTESLFPVRKGRGLSNYKQKRDSSLNYEIDWRDSQDITAIIAHDTNGSVYSWIPKHNMDNVYHLKLRNLLSPECFPRDLRELVKSIGDSGHFLGKVACQYAHVNIHWSLCKYVYSDSDSEWEFNGGKFGHIGRHDSRRLNEILILTTKQQANFSSISRRNSI